MPSRKKNISGPDFSIESEHSGIIVALDEVGRGPLAGPVMASAVILNATDIPEGLNDSKLLTRKQREEIHAVLLEKAQVAIGVASVEEIDTLNILQASLLAMRRAYEALAVTADIALVDGNQRPGLPCPTRCIVKGDSKSLSIAAASIAAKVTRDREMLRLAAEFPHYGWDTNVGYSTRAHLDSITLHGVTPHHRRSFAPVRAALGDLPAVTKPDVQMELI